MMALLILGSSRLSVPVNKSRRSSWSSFNNPIPSPNMTASPPAVEQEFAVDIHPAWLALALLGQKPEIKAWGDVGKTAEKVYKKAMKGGYGTKCQWTRLRRERIEC